MGVGVVTVVGVDASVHLIQFGEDAIPLALSTDIHDVASGR